MSKTIKRSCVVPCGPETAYKEWLEYVWIGGADFGLRPTITEPGDPETGQGNDFFPSRNRRGWTIHPCRVEMRFYSKVLQWCLSQHADKRFLSDDAP